MSLTLKSRQSPVGLQVTVWAVLALLGCTMSVGSFSALAQSADHLDLKVIMQDPDWIGPPVEQAWWHLKDNSYLYTLKDRGAATRTTYQHTADNSEVLAAAELETADGRNPLLSQDGRVAVSQLKGTLLARDMASGKLTPLFRGDRPVGRAHFSHDGRDVLFAYNGQWWRVPRVGGLAYPITDLRFADAPYHQDDALAKEQLALFTTLETQRRDQQQQHEQQIQQATEAPHLGPAPWYLGSDHTQTGATLSADGRWLLMAVSDQGPMAGAQDKMPHYVTRSGYVEIEDVRRLVGRASPKPESLWLLDLHTQTRHELSLDTLSGLHEDPLTNLKIEQGLTAHSADNPRPVRIGEMIFHPNTNEALVQVFSLDHKDRWTLRISAEQQTVNEVHRLTDPAWISWDLNELGWIGTSMNAWLLSEETGYSHLYRIDADGQIAAITQGNYEIRNVAINSAADAAYALANSHHPTEWDLHKIDLSTGEVTPISKQKGVEDFALHPTQPQAILRYSASYTPTQAAIIDLTNGELRATTDTRTATYKAITWQSPEFVAIPSSHGAQQPIWSKFYRAAKGFEGPRPVVMFVHGAGYTQNTHHKFPYYFREQMFHNLLTSRGYHVLDMDYRASEGYGRNWRTAIYRHMGKPELEDYLDGVAWLVAEHNADPNRIGIYGGSYGGFMTFMALFNAPEVFKAGAALRPVTDWRHYNHSYTSRILNTPQVDPEAHRRSSPIEFTQNFQGHLLISHGMLDDNVFYKDSVRLAQRLIEQEKTQWELASYPLERHGYVYPESWLDQYRRIFALFERTIGDSTPNNTTQ